MRYLLLELSYRSILLNGLVTYRRRQWGSWGWWHSACFDDKIQLGIAEKSVKTLWNNWILGLMFQSIYRQLRFTRYPILINTRLWYFLLSNSPQKYTQLEGITVGKCDAKIGIHPGTIILVCWQDSCQVLCTHLSSFDHSSSEFDTQIVIFTKFEILNPKLGADLCIFVCVPLEFYEFCNCNSIHFCLRKDSTIFSLPLCRKCNCKVFCNVVW